MDWFSYAVGVVTCPALMFFVGLGLQIYEVVTGKDLIFGDDKEAP